MHHTGVALAKLGYVVLCPDALCFEERQDPDGKLKAGNFERFEFLRYVVAGKCMAWKNILDMRRAVDYLAAARRSAPTGSAATATRWARRTPGSSARGSRD